MPTPSNGTALLGLSAAIPNAPWAWDKWVDITQINIPPWCVTDPKSVVGWGKDKAAQVKEYMLAFSGKSEADQAAFAKAQRKKTKNRKKTVARRAKGKAKAKAVDTSSESGSTASKSKVGIKASAGSSTSRGVSSDHDEDESNDSDAAIRDAVDEGRKTWNEWTTERFTKWQINKRVDAVLANAKKDPLTVMRKLKSAEVRVALCS